MRKMNSGRRALVGVALLGAAAIMLSACATPYQAPTGLTPEQSATIEVDVLRARWVGLVSVDGQSVGKMGGMLGQTSPVVLTPGQHQVYVKYEEHGKRSATATLTFVAEAGHRYAVQSAFRDLQMYFLLVDAVSGKPVPLIKPAKSG